MSMYYSAALRGFVIQLEKFRLLTISYVKLYCHFSLNISLFPVGRLASIGKNPVKVFLSWEPPESPKWFQREFQACPPHRLRTAGEVKASTLLRGLAAETFGKTKGKDGFHGTQKIFLCSFDPHSSSRVLKRMM